MDKNDVLLEAKHALETLDTEEIIACYTSDFSFEDTTLKMTITTREELRAYFTRLFKMQGVAFSDIHIYPGDTWAAIEWTQSFDKGGKRINVRGASVIELQGNKIKRESLYYDSSGYKA